MHNTSSCACSARHERSKRRLMVAFVFALLVAFGCIERVSYEHEQELAGKTAAIEESGAFLQMLLDAANQRGQQLNACRSRLREIFGPERGA